MLERNQPTNRMAPVYENVRAIPKRGEKGFVRARTMAEVADICFKAGEDRFELARANDELLRTVLAFPQRDSTIIGTWFANLRRETSTGKAAMGASVDERVAVINRFNRVEQSILQLVSFIEATESKRSGVMFATGIAFDVSMGVDLMMASPTGWDQETGTLQMAMRLYQAKSGLATPEKVRELAKLYEPKARQVERELRVDQNWFTDRLGRHLTDQKEKYIACEAIKKGELPPIPTWNGPTSKALESFRGRLTANALHQELAPIYKELGMHLDQSLTPAVAISSLEYRLLVNTAESPLTDLSLEAAKAYKLPKKAVVTRALEPEQQRAAS